MLSVLGGERSFYGKWFSRTRFDAKESQIPSFQSRSIAFLLPEKQRCRSNRANLKTLSSVLACARALEGKSLKQIAQELGKPELLQRRGKGVGGQLLQSCFGINPDDSRAEPDIPEVQLDDGRYADVELKIVPLITKKRGVRVKERCKVTNIQYEKLLKETWQSSRAKHKLTAVIFIFYRYTDAATWAESKVDKIVSWMLDESSARDTIVLDWKRTWQFVNDGRAHEISEGHGMILGACTTGAGHDSKYVKQPKNELQLARKRAFALKPAFLQTTYNYATKPSNYRSINTLSKRVISGDLQSEILSHLNKWRGKRLGDIASDLKIPCDNAKQAGALLVRRALGVVADDKKLLELEVAGVKPKTIPVRRSDLRPLEAMSFPPMLLKDFVEEDWDDSEFRAHLDCLLFIPVFAEKPRQNVWTRVLGKSFFWIPSEDEEDGIEREWRMFQNEIMAGKAAYKRVKGRRVSCLTPGSMTHYIHLRPKSRDGTVDDVGPDGRRTQKLCFWLNQKFVQEILRKNLSEDSESLDSGP